MRAAAVHFELVANGHACRLAAYKLAQVGPYEVAAFQAAALGVAATGAWGSARDWESVLRYRQR